MHAELRYNHTFQNSRLIFYGGYPTDQIKEAIKKAGWKLNDLVPPMIKEESLEPWMSTEEFFQPVGKGLFGGSTLAEGIKNIAVLRNVLTPLGVKLGNPKKFSISELL